MLYLMKQYSLFHEVNIFHFHQIQKNIEDEVYFLLQHHLENPSSQDPDGSHPWRCIIFIWFSSSDLF